MKFGLYTFIPVLFAGGLTAFAGDPKPIVNQASNDDIDLQGTALTVRNDIKLALDGPDLPADYIAVRMKVTPKTGKPMRISPDDFTILSRKNGERSAALSPHQIAGGGTVLVVKQAVEQPRGDGTTIGGPVWGGVSVGKRPSGHEDAAVRTGTSQEDGPLLKLLTEKELAEKDAKEPVEGLLYFAVDPKLKPKDLSLIYQGAAGKLVIDFK